MTIAIIFAVIGILVLIAGAFKYTDSYSHAVTTLPNRILRWVGGGILALAVLFVGLSSFYTQDVGQANVLKDWTGNIVDISTESGFHTKAPWVDIVTFDVRNQRLVFVGGEGSNSVGDNGGGEADGPQITVQDAEGVTANFDVAVRYSLAPSAVEDIYSQYLNEENLRNRLLVNDIRSVVREVPGDFKTIDILTDRSAVQAAITKALIAKWADDGIIVEEVSLQEIRYAQSVTDSYAAAQQAKINVETAKADLESATVKAQQRIAEAEASAKANELLQVTLTDAVLKQHYLDTLVEVGKSGNLIVVPEGFNGILNVK